MSSDSEISNEGPEDEQQVGPLKKILLIPCMTKSLMYGISGGLGVGLAHFLFTSNVRKATNYGFGSYLLIMFGTWGVCRWEFAKARQRYLQVQNALQNREGGSNIKLIDPKDV